MLLLVNKAAVLNLAMHPFYGPIASRAKWGGEFVIDAKIQKIKRKLIQGHCQLIS